MEVSGTKIFLLCVYFKMARLVRHGRFAAARLLPGCSATTYIRSYAGNDDGWFSTKLLEIGKLSPDTTLFTFQLPEDKKKLSVPIGHSFFVQPIPSDKEGEEVIARRSYTPLLQERDDGTVRLAVKVYEQGPLTQYLSSLKVGDSVNMKGPKGRFNEDFLFYGEDKPKTLCMVAGGSGITPCLQVRTYKREYIKNNRNCRSFVQCITAGA